MIPPQLVTFTIWINQAGEIRVVFLAAQIILLLARLLELLTLPRFTSGRDELIGVVRSILSDGAIGRLRACKIA